MATLRTVRIGFRCGPIPGAAAKAEVPDSGAEPVQPTVRDTFPAPRKGEDPYPVSLSDSPL